jgi:hypothetical protein
VTVQWSGDTDFAESSFTDTTQEEEMEEIDFTIEIDGLINGN